MAFVGPPPGFPGPQNAAQTPPAAPTELTQLFQLMQAQMQQQQAQQALQLQARQAQQQQVTDMLKVMMQLQSSSLPPVGSTVIGTTKGLDEKHFRRITKFDNKGESWKEWRTRFMTAVRESSHG